MLPLHVKKDPYVCNNTTVTNYTFTHNCSVGVDAKNESVRDSFFFPVCKITISSLLVSSSCAFVMAFPSAQAS